MAAVSSFEGLRRPCREDYVRFSSLFPSLFEKASPEARRTAAAALSRLDRVPDDIVELIVNQPVETAAPFISHYENLSEATLARAIARHGAGHARAAARRANISHIGLYALWGLKDESVDRALKLRGLTVDSVFAADIDIPELDALENMGKSRPPLARLDELNGTDAASEGLRDVLRQMALPEGQSDTRTSAAPAVHHMADLRDAWHDFGPDSVRAGLGRKAHLERMARFAANGNAEWFATALADAMGSGVALAERIMLDLSGRQLATAMLALGAHRDVVITALQTYFPHLGNMVDGRSRAMAEIEALDKDACIERLEAWQRADAYTRHLSEPDIGAGRNLAEMTAEEWDDFDMPEASNDDSVPARERRRSA
ncbi:MAG: hypothetical protein CML29_01725 [Rhizobiales bacterium]|nr:hypothetical protein [Hyphomicrobiales bacterium]MBA68034.1 hypothetical protein [Hyphomicrobiales bacterium]